VRLERDHLRTLLDRPDGIDTEVSAYVKEEVAGFQQLLPSLKVSPIRNRAPGHPCGARCVVPSHEY
jgi:hypothetical protein